jgi:DNA-binding response OmpR family regulator
MRVLLIEDSEHLRRSLSTALRKAGYALDAATDGEEGLSQAMVNTYDVIVLDLMLPKLDGLTLLQTLRRDGHTTHVLVLTAKTAVADRVRGLQSGADDYLIKPFALEEFLARVQALCRRLYHQKDPCLNVGDLEINTAACSVRRAGRDIDLTPREYRLLEYLARRAGEVVSRSEIWLHVYDEQTEPMSNAVDSAICALRKKIDPVGVTPLLATRRGLGYVLERP